MIETRTIPNWNGHASQGAGLATPTVPDWTGAAEGPGVLRAAVTVPDWAGALGQATPVPSGTIPEWTGLSVEANGRPVRLGAPRRPAPATSGFELSSAA